jgi:phosphate transport system substrate-binding protein
MSRQALHLLVVVFMATMLLPACHRRDRGPQLTGTVTIDGSSTVYPITKAVAHEFTDIWQKVQVKNEVGGTSCGLRKFTDGDVDIATASRRLTADEIKNAEKHGIKYLEIPLAYDGVTIVVNHKNNFASKMTLEELSRTLGQNDEVKRWNQIRAEWPDKDVHIYGSKQDSGTFEFLVAAATGKELPPRADCQVNEDNPSLIADIRKDENGFGFIGFGHYHKNRNYLKALALDAGKGPIMPSFDTVKDLTYQPLSRSLYLFVNTKSLHRPEVAEFVKLYLKRAPDVVLDAHYVPLHTEEYEKAAENVEKLTAPAESESPESRHQ